MGLILSQFPFASVVFDPRSVVVVVVFVLILYEWRFVFLS